ncbi:MAG: hypothetical protein ACRD12_11035 [Acidimicrobiales bacterium]
MNRRAVSPRRVAAGTGEALPAVAQSRPAPRGTVVERLTWRWALLLAVAWPAAVAINLALEPAPSEPAGAANVIANSILLVFFVAFVVTEVSAARRRASATTWSTFTAGASIALTIACPLSGHHHGIGVWWFLQLAVCSTMVVLSRAAHCRGVSRGPAPDQS